ncbi:NAD-dependent epimerase/dehydratase family protein [Shewanella sp. ALD9]|uniref:NAD-dependent epimerase/dehydratase family protein n=1 Tax=Shewanella sp. ALD9 TaxID=2058330 RepID=UPI000C330522|nr:NAD-dependent epimerase/dehydratase family protein [Shewanella sp. ALD9]PKH31900.1 UDP-glucose 4-epimerase [Shewanella sp. ALD9]
MIGITGYSGFVGKVLISELKPSKLLLLGRKKPKDIFDYDFCEFDLSAINHSLLATSLSKARVLIHIAARVHIMNDINDNPLAEFRAVNTQGTLSLAKQAADAGVKRFIFISSIKVNGETTTNRPPFTKSDNPAPIDPYGISKAEAEMQLLALGKITGMEIVIIRPPLVYGEGVKANFSSLMSFVNKGYPLPFKAIKNNKRSLISVYNLVDLIKLCIEHPNAANQIFLASDDNDLSTSAMVSLMAKVQKRKSFFLPIPVWCFQFVGVLFNKRDVIDRLTGSLQLDITHTKNTLDWKPPYSVDHGFQLSTKK